MGWGLLLGWIVVQDPPAFCIAACLQYRTTCGSIVMTLLGFSACLLVGMALILYPPPVQLHSLHLLYGFCFFLLADVEVGGAAADAGDGHQDQDESITIAGLNFTTRFVLAVAPALLSSSEGIHSPSLEL